MTRTPRGFQRVALTAALALAVTGPAAGSDHADPTSLDRLEGGITDLFAFPLYTSEKGVKQRTKPDKTAAQVGEPQPDSLVVVLCARRLLSGPPPYAGLSKFTYKIHLDLTTRFDADHTPIPPDQLGKMPPDKARHALQVATRRYGGVTRTPETIAATVTFKFVLRDDLRADFGPANIENKDIVVTDADGPGKAGTPHELPKKERLKFGAGVRDDPFIFPQFFGTNVFAMVAVVPYDCLPPGQRQFIVWGTSERHGTQIDHVGRSQRTQLPRFDLLNTVPPSRHVATLRDAQDNPGLVQDVLRVRIPTEFNFRPFDLVPDVMYYSRDADAGYPNGRKLEDDVALLSCAAGDCQLFELSQGHPKSGDYVGGRPTANDKPFSDTFPFLAEPWPDSPMRTPPEVTTRTQLLATLIGGAVAAAFVFPWVLYFRALRRLRRAVAPAAADPPPKGPGMPA